MVLLLGAYPTPTPPLKRAGNAGAMPRCFGSWAEKSRKQGNTANPVPPVLAAGTFRTIKTINFSRLPLLPKKDSSFVGAGFRALPIGKGGYRQAFLRLFYDNNWWFYLYSSYLSYVITSESMKKYMYIVYIYYIYNKFIIIILYIILIVILVVTIQSPSLHFTRW